MRVFLIALGGALGTVLRYGAGLLAARVTALPLGTWLVNLLGCFVLALVAELVLRGARLSDDARLAITVGFCGGLTTYSSFNQEAITVWREQHAALAVGYVAATLLACAAAGLCGTAVGRALS